MKSVGVAYFQKHCPELLAKLDAEGLVIHENGKPIAKVTPIKEVPSEQQDDEVPWASLIGSLRDEVTIHGDIFSTGIRWDAES